MGDSVEPTPIVQKLKLTLVFGAALLAAFLVAWSFRSSGRDTPMEEKKLVITPAVIASSVPVTPAPPAPEVALAELAASGVEGGSEAFRDWVYGMPAAEIHRLIWHCLAPGNVQIMGGTAVHLLEAMAEWDPYSAIDIAWRITDDELGKNARNAIMAEWGMYDPKAAIAYVVTLPDIPLRMGLGPAIVKAWASYAAEDAFYYLAGLPLEDGGRLIKSAAAGLSVPDLDTFHAYLSVIGNQELIGRTIDGLTYAMPDLTSEDLIALADSFIDQTAIRRAILSVAGRRFSGDRLHEGLALFGSFESYDMNDHFAFALGREQIKGDIIALFQAAADTYDSSWHRRIYQAMILESVPKHMDLIYDFAEALPNINRHENNPRCQAWISLSEGVAKISHESAFTWIEGLESGADKSAAIYGMAREVMQTDIPTAAVWVIKMPEDQRLRPLAARNLLRHWKRTDEPAARNWAVLHGFEFPE